MKIIYLLLFTLSILSCTPQSNFSEDASSTIPNPNCCGDDSPILPPPPIGD